MSILIYQQINNQHKNIKMKLIELKSIANGFASIDFGDIDMTTVLKEGKLEFVEGKTFRWNRSTGNAISDSPFYIGAMPIFDTEKLSGILSSLNVASAEFDVEGRSYTIINAPHFNGDIINREKSEMRTFRSGKIMNIKKYVFNSGFNYPQIFTPSEFVMNTFCKKETAQMLLSCEFNQLLFVECEVEA